jgi:hypothetical protein
VRFTIVAFVDRFVIRNGDRTPRSPAPLSSSWSGGHPEPRRPVAPEPILRHSHLRRHIPERRRSDELAKGECPLPHIHGIRHGVAGGGNHRSGVLADVRHVALGAVRRDRHCKGNSSARNGRSDGVGRVGNPPSKLPSISATAQPRVRKTLLGICAISPDHGSVPRRRQCWDGRLRATRYGDPRRHRFGSRSLCV